MAYNPTRKKKFRIKWGQFFPMMIFFAVIIGVSFYAGVLWANSTRPPEEIRIPGSTASSSSAVSSSSSAPSSSSEAGEPQNQESSSEAEQQDPASSSQAESTESSLPPEEPEKPVVVAKNDYVSLSYFDDAVFVGDSITTGLSGYGLFEADQVVASTSINLEAALYKTPFTNAAGAPVSMADRVKELAPKKIYLMLGTNGIEWIDGEKLADMYQRLVVKLKEAVPGAVFYIQSVFPVTTALDQNPNRDLTNDKINAFNQRLMAIAEAEGCYFLNVAEALRDENGALPADASPSDGVHFTVEYYQKWIEYMRYHTVPEAPSADTGTLSAAE